MTITMINTQRFWTFNSLVCAFIDLFIAYFLLFGSIIAFFAANFLQFFGVSFPSPYNVQNPNSHLKTLLVDYPTDKVSSVQHSVIRKFPFDSIFSSVQNCNVNDGLILDRGDCNGDKFRELEGEASCSSKSDARKLVRNENGDSGIRVEKERGFDVKGKGGLNYRLRGGFRRRRKGSFNSGKHSVTSSTSWISWADQQSDDKERSGVPQGSSLSSGGNTGYFKLKLMDVQDTKLSAFLEDFSDPLHYRKPEFLFRQWVFGAKMKNGLKIIHIQFWAPVTIGGRRLLSTYGQPFSVSRLGNDLAKYRVHSLGYEYNIDETNIEAMIISGAASSAFVNRFLVHYKEHDEAEDPMVVKSDSTYPQDIVFNDTSDTQNRIPVNEADKDKMIVLLTRELEEEQVVRASLYVELEKERNAAATAADEAMSMILRLQEEKASIEMESRQYQRMIEEKSAYDEEEMNILKEIVLRREREKHFLEKEVEAYRQMTRIENDQFYDNNNNNQNEQGYEEVDFSLQEEVDRLLPEKTIATVREERNLKMESSEDVSNETDLPVYDVHVIDHKSEKSNGNKNQQPGSSSETSVGVGLPPISSKSSLRRNSTSAIDNERTKLDTEVDWLRERLRIVQEGREKLNFSIDNREKESLQLQLLEDIARQLQEIRMLTQPRTGRQVSLPLPSAKGVKKRRCRSASIGPPKSS